MGGNVAPEGGELGVAFLFADLELALRCEGAGEVSGDAAGVTGRERSELTFFKIC